MNEDKEDGCHIPTMEVEEITAAHLLPESKRDQAPPLYLDEYFDKGLEIDDISSIFCYGLRTNCGGLDSSTSGEGRDELNCGGFDDMLREDEVANLLPTICLTNACEDFFLDVDFAKKVPELDYDFCEESGSGNSRSESHSPGTSNEAVAVPKSCIRVPECQNNQFEPTTSQLNSAFGSTSWSEIPVADEMGLKCSAICNLKDIDEAKPIASLLRRGKSQYKNEKDMNLHHDFDPCGVSCSSRRGEFDNNGSPVGEAVEGKDLSLPNVSNDSSVEVRTVGPLCRQNRLRKPTRRLIEELAQLRSKHNRGGKESSTSSSKRDNVGVRTCNKHQGKGAKAAPLISNMESPGISPRLVPFQEQRESSMKYAIIVGPDSDVEYDPVCSSSRIRKSKCGVDRRKHNKLWSLSEVVKLVDGISQFGVGKWTAIRRAFFSSSSYRTSLDIRDKWRNLLRSSCSQLKSKREDEQTRKNGSHHLPKSLLQRVIELASVHPYPRRGAKLSRTGQRDLALALSD
ncbi:hypothetical protein Ancab_031878 [Ancistrocladus abbreviatus]